MSDDQFIVLLVFIALGLLIGAEWLRYREGGD